MNNLDKSFYRISAKGLVIRDGKFLLIKEENGLWELPGGGIDDGESPKTCIVREVKEEMGLEVTSVSDKPSYFFTSEQLSGKYLIANIVYEMELKDLDFTPSDECVKLGFFTKEETLSMKTYPNIQVFAEIFDPKLHA